MSQAAENRRLAGAAGIADRERRLVVSLLIAAALLIAAYWVIWFFVDRSLLATDTRPAYYEFEDAFPLADGWLALCLIAAIVQLQRRHASALFWLLAGGGAGLYLAGMDVLYDIEHRIWFRGGAGGLIELAINVLTVAASVGLLAWSWRRRNPLLAGG
jgi:hypothetical protein